MFISSINDKEIAHLKRKRKYSTKGMSGTKRGNRKTQKFGNKQNPYEDNEEDNAKVGDNKDDCEEEDDKEYCIPDCLMGRKYQEVEMIACDSCNNWFHPKCINMSNEEFKRFQLLSWNCDDCKE